MTDADHQPPLLHAEGGHGAIVRAYQVACRNKEERAFGRQAHLPRRAFQQAPPQLGFQATQLQADRGLGAVQSLGRTGEALQIRGQDKGFHGIEVEGSHG